MNGHSRSRDCDAKRETVASGCRDGDRGGRCRRMVHGKAVAAEAAGRSETPRRHRAERDVAAAGGKRGCCAMRWRAWLPRQEVAAIAAAAAAGGSGGRARCWHTAPRSLAVTARRGRRDRGGRAKQAGAAHSGSA